MSLLRYVEVDSAVRRGLTVLKMRGSAHDAAIRDFTIGDDGRTIGDPFSDAHGILRRVLSNG